MASKSSKDEKKRFVRERLARRLKNEGNGRWTEAMRRDLQELGEDEEGLEHLTKAIKAVLRSDRWRRK